MKFSSSWTLGVIVCCNRQARRHEVEQGGVQQVVSDEIDLQVLDKGGQPGRFRRQVAGWRCRHP